MPVALMLTVLLAGPVQTVPTATAGPGGGASIQNRTADGPELPEWLPLLGEIHLGCTTGNPNPSGVVDHTCHQNSPVGGGVLPYHPWPAIDLHTPEGAPVRATGAGTVISVGHTTTVPEVDPLNPNVSDEALAARAGGWIVVAHAGGPNSVYKHMGDWLVVPGDHVEPGQVIGIIAYPGTRQPMVHYDEQDPAIRFNAPEARVPFGTMLARDATGAVVTYPDAAGTSDWNAISQQSVIASTGWVHESTAGSEADLRAAVASYASSTEDGPFTINLSADVTLTAGPIVYTGDELLMIDGDPDLDGNRRRLTASAGSRIIEAPHADAALELRGIDLFGNGAVTGDGGLVSAAGPITLVNADASGGAVSGSGGAFSSGEWVSLVRAELFNNTAGLDGGAVRAARVAVVDSTVHHNVAGGRGGGLSSAGAPQPGAHIGGEFAQTDANRVSNSTISLNQAGSDGGGLATDGDLYVQNATIHQNTSTTGSDSVAVIGKLTTAATAFSSLPGRSNCQVGVTRSLGGNLDSGTTCALNGPFDIQGRSARLGTLRMNTGPTPTHYPLVGSPLINAFIELPDSAKGTFLHAPPCSPNGRAADQRSSGPLDTLPGRSGNGGLFDYRDPSHGRLDGACDIGAVEAIYPRHPYGDVAAWIDLAIRWISSTDRDTPRVMGPDTSSFNPDGTITRAQVVNALYGFAGRPDVGQLPRHPFVDVAPWVDSAVTWITADPPGPAPPIMSGYPDDTFRDGILISRGELVRALHRLTGELPVAAFAGTTPVFPDVPAWINASVRWITTDLDGGGPGGPVMDGYPDGNFRPNLSISRGQFARAAYRLASTPGVWNAGNGTAVDAEGDLTVAGQGFPVGALWVPL